MLSISVVNSILCEIQEIQALRILYPLIVKLLKKSQILQKISAFCSCPNYHHNEKRNLHGAVCQKSAIHCGAL